MTIHEKHPYERRFDWAHISKGPGTKALEATGPGDCLDFTGEVLEPQYSYFPGKSLRLQEKVRRDDHLWELWFWHSGYPIYAIHILYDSYHRSGTAGLWKQELSPTANAEEKAAHADSGSMTEAPVSFLWLMSGIFGFWVWVGLVFGFWTPEQTGWSVLWSLVGGLSALGAVEFAAFAIWKQDRDQFWKAIDQINALDLRRGSGV